MKKKNFLQTITIYDEPDNDIQKAAGFGFGASTDIKESSDPEPQKGFNFDTGSPFNFPSRDNSDAAISEEPSHNITPSGSDLEFDPDKFMKKHPQHFKTRDSRAPRQGVFGRRKFFDSTREFNFIEKNKSRESIKTTHSEIFLANKIKKNPLFSGVSRKCMEGICMKIVKVMYKVELSEGDTLIKEGDTGDALYIIEQGHLNIFTTENDKEILVAEAVSGQSVGEKALLYNIVRTATLRATKKCICWGLSIDKFKQTRSWIADWEKKNIDRRLKFLKKIWLFQNLEPHNLSNLAQACEEIDFKKGSVLYENKNAIEPGSDELSRQESKRSRENFKPEDKGSEGSNDFFIIYHGRVQVKKKKKSAPVSLGLGLTGLSLGPMDDEKEQNITFWSKLLPEYHPANDSLSIEKVKAKSSGTLLRINHDDFQFLIVPLIRPESDIPTEPIDPNTTVWAPEITTTVQNL
eukprot:UN30923